MLPSEGSYPERVWVSAANDYLTVCALYVHGMRYAPHQRLIATAFSQLVNDQLIHPVTGEVVRRLAVSGPPRHGKTSVISEHGIPWYLGRSPWKRVIHITSSDPLSNAYDTAVATTLAENERHTQVFPNCQPWFKKGWSGLSGRYLTASDGKDPSFKAYGIDAKILGSGADLIILDDPVDQHQERSEVEMLKIKSLFDATQENRVNPGGHVAFLGHRWGPNDFLQHLIESWGFAWLNLPALTEA